MTLTRIEDVSWHHVDESTSIGTVSESAVASVVYMRLDGEHRAAPNRRSEYVYTVLDGSVDFAINGYPSFTATAGDVVHVPVDTGRTMRGTARMLIVNSPPFRIEDEQPL